MMPHSHKFFAYNVKADFEVAGKNQLGEQLYKRVEYLISGCNCGQGIRTRITDGDNDGAMVWAFKKHQPT